MSDLLPYGRQSIDADDIAAVTRILQGDWLTTGPAVAAFEAAAAEKLGAAHAIACSSGTAGLHLAALALDLGPGDFVIVPAMSFSASANAARYVGAEVIFADVDAASGLMGPEQFSAALDRAGDKPVKAVVPVHLNGQCEDMAAISALAASRRIAIIEDACHAIGGDYDDAGKRHTIGACGHSNMAMFSMHAVKTFTAGEGGLVTTNDPKLAVRMAQMRSHGITREPDDFSDTAMAFDEDGAVNPWYYELQSLGFNYRITDFQCALAQSQLARLDGFVARRRALAAQYDKLLAKLAPVLQPVARVATCRAAWHLYAVRIEFAALGLSRAQVMGRLRADGIGSQVHYIPIHRQPYYRERYGHIDLPGVIDYYDHCLSLPLFPAMADDDVARVVGTLKGIIR